MSDTNTGIVPTTTETVAGSVASGVATGLEQSLPAIEAVLSATHPEFAAALQAAQLAEPTLQALLAARSAGTMTDAAVDAGIADMQTSIHGLLDTWNATAKAVVAATLTKPA